MIVVLNYAKPIIERFGEDIPIDSERKEAANVICKYFEDRSNLNARGEYYAAVTGLLKSLDSYRILLYLPFYELVGAPDFFKEAYRSAWYELICRADIRENFYKGDCLEINARPDMGIERVVKCAHLTPWLLSSGVITFKTIFDILDTYKDIPIVLQSFRDTLGYIYDHKILPYDKIRTLYNGTRDVPERVKVEPLYVSENRIKWLEESRSEPRDLVTPNAHLDGPFSSNIKAIRKKIEKISAGLKPNEIILVGGSQLKGYGVTTSDLDIWKLDDIKNDPFMGPGKPDGAHLYFNSIWIGGSNVKNLSEFSRKMISSYSKSSSTVRWHSIERLESDLLQYRLLHKGFSRFTGRSSFKTDLYPEMDGDCPFYDDEYRVLATKLYAKYVQMPTWRNKND